MVNFVDATFTISADEVETVISEVTEEDSTFTLHDRGPRAPDSELTRSS